MQRLENGLVKSPQMISATIRTNRNRRLTGACGMVAQSPSTRGYLVQEVPFNGAKTGAYLMFGIGEVFDMMERGEWHLAEAHLGMLLAAGEQAAMDDWRWHNASRLILQPLPPFHSLIGVPGSTMEEPLTHLADPGWLGACMSYAKDVAVFKEAGKHQKPPPKGNRTAPDAKTPAETPEQAQSRKQRKGNKGGGKGDAADGQEP